MHIFPVRNYELKTKKTFEEIKEILRVVYRKKFEINDDNELSHISFYPYEIKIFNDSFDIYFSYYEHLFERHDIYPNLTGVFYREDNAVSIIRLTTKIPLFEKIFFLFFVFIFCTVYFNTKYVKDPILFHLWPIFIFGTEYYRYKDFIRKSDTLKDKIKNLLFAIECENSVRNK